MIFLQLKKNDVFIRKFHLTLDNFFFQKSKIYKFRKFQNLKGRLLSKMLLIFITICRRDLGSMERPSDARIARLALEIDS